MDTLFLASSDADLFTVLMFVFFITGFCLTLPIFLFVLAALGSFEPSKKGGVHYDDSQRLALEQLPVPLSAAVKDPYQDSGGVWRTEFGYWEEDFFYFYDGYCKKY